MSHVLARRLAVFVAFAAALALVSTFVLRASSAAFTAQTVNPNNSFVAADIQLSDSQGGDSNGGVGTALFTVEGMVPGQVETRCIDVTYTGTIDPLAVDMYTSGLQGGAVDPFEAQFNVTVFESAAGATCVDADTAPAGGTGPAVFGDTLQALGDATAYADADNPAVVFDPDGTGGAADTRAYTIQIELDAATGNTFLGDTIAPFSFVWEVQSN